MVLVIAVVLLSVLYPARVAARIAIPDVNRTFKLPPPVNNTIQVTLPFLMKYQRTRKHWRLHPRVPDQPPGCFTRGFFNRSRRGGLQLFNRR